MYPRSIIFKGIKFNRQPESDKREHRLYYKPHAGHIRNGIQALHQEVWKSAFGDIPEGYHIHHRDGNALNNEIDNLVCKKEFDHLSEHSKEYYKDNEERCRAHLEEIRPLAAVWHRSDEGRQWHSEHGIEAYAKREYVKKVCEVCGCEFETKNRGKGTRFCSNKCKSQDRRDRGADNVKKVCVICNECYTSNKYDGVKTCSRSCAGKLQSQTKSKK